MVPIPIRYMGTTTLGKMWVLVREVGWQWRVSDDDMEPIRQVEPEHIPKPVFERHHRPRHVNLDQPQLTLRDHLGLDHPHFPHASPVVPPPAHLRGVGNDGVGTSGTYPRDTDDDNEESSKDKEDEFERSE
ncbi:unnamed protein product [Lactuca saligna]|uniref:Uncharacterized protein n=1 Tax=Lactuca saligna TaxID=75948 RepID=A0AA35ZKT7_LACSI|nr:unnamed protein product [Lactuca saligna]